MVTKASLSLYGHNFCCYLFFQVRRWAIGAARSLGKVDRDDFYDLQDIFTCMFYIVELRIPQNFPDMDTSYDPTTKMTLLQPHLYDSKNAKNYWLGMFLCPVFTFGGLPDLSPRVYVFCETTDKCSMLS